MRLLLSLHIMTYIGEQECYIYYRFSAPKFLFEGLSRRKKEMCFNFRYINLVLSENETVECNFFLLFLSRCVKAVELLFGRGLKITSLVFLPSFIRGRHCLF